MKKSISGLAPQRHKPSAGFTLVELIVVIIVIVILAAIGIMTYARLQTQSRDGKREADISVLQSQLETYYQKNNEYPGSCEYSSPSSCTTYSSGVQIQLNQSLATLKTALPGLPNDFGDPLLGSGSSIFNISVNFPGYFYIGGMLNNTGGGFGQSSQKTFSWPGGSLTCNYSISLSSGQQSSYIIAYYDETNKKPVFLRGQHGVQFQWPYDPVAQPACVTS